MSRYIDADAYAAEMKERQDALKELMDDADALDNWEMYDGLSRAFSIFVEAKLTLDVMPTVDAVQVVRCGECKRRYKPLDDDARNEIYCEFMGSTMRKDDFCSRGCADGERRSE